MTIVQLQYFIETIREGSYHAAAQKLYVSTQTISKAINALERELEVELILRKRRELILTEFGEIFLEKAIDLTLNFFELHEIARNHRSNIPKRKSYSIAISSAQLRGLTINPSFLKSFQRIYSAIDLTVIPNQSGACLAALEEEVVDAAIILGRVQKPNLKCTTLFSITPQIALSKKSDLAHEENIYFESLEGASIVRPDDLRFLQQEIAQQFKKRNYRFTFVDFPLNIEGFRDFLDTKNNIMFVMGNSSVKQLYPTAVVKPLAETDRFQIPVCFIRPKESDPTLLNHLQRYLAKTVGKSLYLP